MSAACRPRATALLGAFLVLAAAWSGGARAQSDLDLPLEAYMKQAGDRARLVAAGELRIDGQRVFCGRRPTVIDPGFDSWGGAYPGYLILNPRRLDGLSTTIKMFIYAHECGHQFVGRDETAADCFAAKRGRRYGWLDGNGVGEICRFMSTLKGDWDHAAGPDRCQKLKQCYRQAAPRAARN